MKMKKLDLSGLKKFMFQKGERVGLAVCALIAVLILAFGFMKAGGSSTPYAANFKKIHEDWDRRTSGAVPKQASVTAPKAQEHWTPVIDDITWVPIMPMPDASDTKRRKPKIVKIMDDPGHIQADVVVGGYFANKLKPPDRVFAFDAGGKNALGRPQPIGTTGADKNLVKILKPDHMVIVTAVFPMRKQLEEYQRQLHYGTLGELLAKNEDLPKALGLTVFRREVKDGKGDWEKVPVYQYDAEEDKAIPAPRIDKFFREALIDVSNIQAIKPYADHGMMTPLPQLAVPYSNANLNLQDIKVEDVQIKSGDSSPAQVQRRRSPNYHSMMPRGGINARAPQIEDDTAPPVPIPIKDLAPETADKFMGKIDFFDYTGVLKQPDDPLKAVMPGRTHNRFWRQISGQSASSGPRAAANADVKFQIFDSLVRFIDVGLQPGKTYQYTFCLHMANPNRDKKDLVAFQQLAKEKELVSPFSYSPLVTIPNEYYYYVVDERIAPNNHIQGGADWQEAKADASVPFGNWTTAVQVHLWKGGDVDTYRSFADWAIAERLLIRRGEYLGKSQVTVEVPVWNAERTSFEIGFQKQDAKKRNQRQEKTGIPISFLDANTPLLVDFEGGKKAQIKIGQAVIAKDESAVEMLVLTPDGKLLVRNARDDSDPATQAGAERLTRVKNWRDELAALRPKAPGSTPPGRNTRAPSGRRN